ncbi:MAG: hypothetical protein R3C18_06905 [Planctomycetaceae bacterium]
MKSIQNQNFGLVIAYLLPGLITLWGISFHALVVANWFGSPGADAPTVGGFLYVTLGSLSAGMTLSTLRWLVIDRVHHWTGIRQPPWDFSRLSDRTEAFQTLIEIHYRYYQFYANCCVSIPTGAVLHWSAVGFHVGEFVGAVALTVLFFVASRDTLQKYYLRVEGLLSG